MSNPLEEYLNQFRSHLKGIPAEQRDAEVEETRQHLEALIQQYIEYGQSEESATSNAIRQFGSARTIARSTRKTWQLRHSDIRRETMLRRLHLLLGLVLVHSLVTQLLALIFWRLDYYLVPSSRYYYPTWLLFSPYKVASFIDQLPTTLNYWMTSPFNSWMATLFFLVFALCSLRMPREMRTIFFGVFTVLIASALVVQTSVWHPYFVPYRAFDKTLLLNESLSASWRLALFFISSWALCVSLARDKSLIMRPKRTRVT